MATDLARTSFDSARRYTGVVPQQGRVSLEAEENEERTIDAEARRHELLDIVGPAGTPDDGYAVSSAGGFDITIGPGTMYVGGVRVELDAPIKYSDQPDWLDHEGHPDFTPLPTGDGPGGEHVVLVLTETDVTATEDPVLREVALGGPDGAARARILQRVHRLATRGDDCAEALKQSVAAWSKAGLVFDSSTMQLLSKSRLQVEWEPPPTPADPCEPAATGGYLGAENQAIRLQVTAVHANGTFDLLWGWDNASFLYRVAADASANPVLTLERSPVDDFHRPRAGQAVQVLRSAAALVSTDSAVEGYVASHNGEVAELTAPYDPDTKSVQFPAALPAPYTNAAETPQLYLRVWEELLSGNTVGDEITLTGTGVKVVLTVPGGDVPHVGDFWTIAVRPATPQTVFPARLLRTPQPPDGPRMWACPLAVIDWPNRTFDLVDDCRVPFDPLVEQECGDCTCSICVTPGEAAVHGLQALIDAAVANRDPDDRTRRVTVCLRPGRYELEEPLRLRHAHGHLHLEGREGVVLAIKEGHEDEFADGMIVLVGADNVRISGIEFSMSAVGARIGRAVPNPHEVQAFRRFIRAVYRDLLIAIAIRPVHCELLEVDRCVFRFMARDADGAAGDDGEPRNVLGVGVFAGSECRGMRIERNRFLHAAPRGYVADTQSDVVHILVGVLIAPTLIQPGRPDPTSDVVMAGVFIPTLLTDGRIRDNEFDGITVAIVGFADLGEIRIENNAIRDCYGGIWLSSLRAQAYARLGEKYTFGGGFDKAGFVGIAAVLETAAGDPLLILLSVVGRTFPLPYEYWGSSTWEAAIERSTPAADRVDDVAWTKELIEEALEPFKAKRRSRTTKARAAKAEEAEGEGEETIELEAARIPVATHLAAAFRAHPAISEVERAVEREQEPEVLSLRVTGNDVSCGFGERGRSGPALLVWDTDRKDEGSALVCDNRLRSVLSPTAILLRVPEVVADGNLVRSSGRVPVALAVVGADDLVVTGNILRGIPVLPVGRPFPSPLNTWLPLNTVRP